MGDVFGVVFTGVFVMNRWVKRGDQWLVCCSGEVMEGELVTVTHKDGTTKRVLVLKIVEQLEGETLVMAEARWKPADLLNTWRKVDDEWLIRGRYLREGSSVTVHERGDKTSSQVIEKVLRTDELGFQWARAVVFRKKGKYTKSDEYDEWSSDDEAYRSEAGRQDLFDFPNDLGASRWGKNSWVRDMYRYY